MKTAMILAAGRGERLRPLTDVLPKAMCAINNKPLIEYHVENLAKAGFERIIINHAHLGDQIRHYFGNGTTWNIEICYSPEPPGGLETGGGLYQALPLLSKEPFVAVNADIFTNYDFSSLRLLPGYLAHLVLVPNPAHNCSGDFDLDGQQRITSQKVYTFSGIACYRAELFHHCKIGRFSITSLLRDSIAHSKVSGEFYEGLWLDIGSTERLAMAKILCSEENYPLPDGRGSDGTC